MDESRDNRRYVVTFEFTNGSGDDLTAWATDADSAAQATATGWSSPRTIRQVRRQPHDTDLFRRRVRCQAIWGSPR